MTQTLRVKRLRGSSIFKLILIGNVISLALLCGVCSVPAVFGVEILSWNGEYITGPLALVLGPLMGVFAGVLLGLFLGLFTYVGLRIFSLCQSLELEYAPVEEE
jgi:hypothetical protein